MSVYLYRLKLYLVCAVDLSPTGGTEEGAEAIEAAAAGGKNCGKLVTHLHILER